MIVKKVQDRCNVAAHFLMVALFFTFPMVIGLANTILALLLICWLLAGRFRMRWEIIKNNPITLPTILLYSLVVLGTTYTSAPLSDIVTHLSKYSKLLAALILLSLLSEERWRHRCWRAFMAAMFITLVSVYASIWLDLPWSNTHSKGWGIDHHVFGDYITQNVMVSFFVARAINHGLSAVSPSRKCFWYAVGALGAISIAYLSSGRTGYLLLASVLLTFTIASVPKSKKLMAIAALGVVLVAGVLTSQTMDTRFHLAAAEALNSDADNQSSIGHRLYNYKKVPQLMAERPLFGWGTGAYHQQICRVVEKPEWCQVFNWHPHNQFLFFGVEHGLPGILAYAFLIGSIAWRARHIPPQQGVLLLVFAAVLFVDSMFNSPLWSSRENHFFMFVMALLMAEPVASSNQSGAALRAT